MASSRQQDNTILKIQFEMMREMRIEARNELIVKSKKLDEFVKKTNPNLGIEDWFSLLENAQ